MSCPWEGDGRCENPVFQKLDEAQAEVMRLTKERDEMLKYLDAESVSDFGEQFECHLDENQRVREENGQLRAEVERLRGLLRRVSAAHVVIGGPCDYSTLRRDIEEALRG